MKKKIDSLGRIVVPVEVRRALNINLGDTLNMEVENDKIIIFKCQSKCIFCGENEGITFLNGKGICKECLSKVRTMMNHLE